MSRDETRGFQERLRIADNVALQAMEGYGLLSLRKQAGHAKFSVLRDRLYGLLGQLPEDDRAGIAPDYKKPISDTYIETTRDQIRRHRRLDVITNASWTSEHPPLSFRAGSLIGLYPLTRQISTTLHQSCSTWDSLSHTSTAE